MRSIALLFICSILLSSFGYVECPGPVGCAACVLGCLISCAFTLFGVGLCVAACIPNICGPICAITPI